MLRAAIWIFTWTSNSLGRRMQPETIQPLTWKPFSMSASAVLLINTTVRWGNSGTSLAPKRSVLLVLAVANSPSLQCPCSKRV